MDKNMNRRNFIKSGIIIFQNEGLTFSSGFECEITSQIPIQAGTSSSSAIVVSLDPFFIPSGGRAGEMESAKDWQISL